MTSITSPEWILGWRLAAIVLVGLVAGDLVRRGVLRYVNGTAIDSNGWRARCAYAVACAALFSATSWRIGWTAELPAYLFFTAIALQVSIIDVRRRLLPNAVVVPSMAVSVLLLAVAATASAHWGFLGRSIAAGLILFAVYLILALISPRGMGMGDVKLAGLLGLLLGYRGWDVLAAGAFLGFLLGALASIAVLASRQGNRKSTLPFGPFMLAGALAALLVLSPS